MNRLNLFLFSLLIIFSVSALSAQDSKKNWKKLVKDAEELEKLGDLFRAAQNYEEAYHLKKDKKEFAYKAGKNYMETRHYAKAVKCLEDVKNDNDQPQYDKPGFTYACALKQTGQFAEARIAFESFISAYSGADREKIREMAEAEIQGCTFALKALEISNPNISIQLLDFNVNTDRTEYAPMPFADDILYFSSTVSGVSKIYRTQKNKSGAWMTRQVPNIFTGKTTKPHFGNGSFTTDGKRFFFTQCDLVEGAKPMCKIFMMFEKKGNWSDPILLPDHINLVGYNSTHPFITVVEDKEVLYFSSDREGGVGGFDLWYTTRNLDDTSGIEFTLPKNLGININTVVDEFSPHYHYPTQSLYFSSNGRVSAGGFDVFKSIGEKMQWSPSENVGFPLNSSADDLFFIVSEQHGGGYFVSNRLFGKDKQSTTNDDIFYYGEVKKQLLVKGSVYNEKDPVKTPLKDVAIKVFELSGENEILTHERNLSVANEYKIVLSAEKEYRMDVSIEGYNNYSTNISTKGVKSMETRVKDIAMKEGAKVELPVVIVPSDFNSKDNPFVLPETVPINPKTGEPYAEGTAGYKAYNDAVAIAQKGDGNKIYWDNGKLTPFKKDTVVSNIPEVEPRFAIVPETFNSSENTFVLPKTVPIDPKTGKPYAANTDEFKSFAESNTVALRASDRRVYWENGILKPYNEPINLPRIAAKFVVVPEQYNSKDNTYTLPKTVPIDSAIGKPYAAGSDVFKAFTEANIIATKADGRKIYWENGVLKPYLEPIPMISKVDPKFIVVPEKYNSQAYTYTLPITVPNDPENGKAYLAGTPVYKAFTDANTIAEKADNRKVYWDNGVLKPYLEPQIEPKFVIVPPQYNSIDNTYRLPKVIPNDPKTNKPYLKGTPFYKAYEDALAVANKSSNGNVFWDNDILAFVPDNTPVTAPQGQSFKVQVAAMKNLNTAKYEELTVGELADYKVMYEKIQNEITRVVIVPNSKNEDGTYGFKNKEDALKALKLVLEGSTFKSAFVGIYEGDKRLEGLIRLDNQNK